jgi:hypothetical protein
MGAGRTLGAASGAIAVVLFVLGLVFADVAPSSSFPALNADLDRIVAFFDDNRAEAIGLSMCHASSAFALLAFACHLGGVVRTSRPGREGPGTYVVAGGAVAAAFLLLSALLFWTLTRSEVVSESGAAQGLLVLSYLAGGPAVALPLALPLVLTSRAARETGFLPRWLTTFGYVAGGLALLSPLALAWDPFFAALLVSLALAFGWLLVASVVLTRAEAR